MSLAPGNRLGAYEILEPLGSGGMGEVWRARDTRLSRQVAIKGLPEAFRADSERLSRFRREAQTLAALNHPNIAAIYGLEEKGEEPYLVLELVEGETLSARLARGALPAREALALGVQVAAAIEAAHERGIVHRDLKPGNVMVTPAGVAKVLDFGLARIDLGALANPNDSSSPTVTMRLDSSLAGALVGTAAYMSPEQARGKPVDRRTDVWSFGCVLFECFAGRAAFEGGTVSDLIARILEREPDWAALPAGTPARVREVLRRCLRKDAESRPRDIRDVRLELAEIAAGAGGAASAAREKSIAVLPFENLSGADDEYFADGITDEILNALAHLDGLRVAARTSCFAFKGKREDLRSVGEKLEVDTVLEGTVRRAGPRIRITTQLVNAADGYQLWSERYDRELTDVFELQEEIAKAISTRLRGAMADESVKSRARSGTKNLEAYELFLKGRALQIRRGRFMLEAQACFEKAVALDPQYAEALAWLSDTYRLNGIFGMAPHGQVMPRAKDLAQQALAIDPGVPEALATLACVVEQFEWKFAEANHIWERAIAANPRMGQVRVQRALWAYLIGHLNEDQARVEVQRANQDDPLNAWVASMGSFLSSFIGDHEQALAEAERSHALDPESYFAHWGRMRALTFAGQYEPAIALAPALLNASGRHPWTLGLLAWCYGQRKLEDKARAVYDELEGRSRHEFVSDFWLATSASSAGLVEEAGRHARRAIAGHDPLVIWMRKAPLWGAVRRDPEIESLFRGVFAEIDRAKLAAIPAVSPTS
jgi:serine/threonine-protein kinase